MARMVVVRPTEGRAGGGFNVFGGHSTHRTAWFAICVGGYTLPVPGETPPRPYRALPLLAQEVRGTGEFPVDRHLRVGNHLPRTELLGWCDWLSESI
jgi:hypothetical protein